MLRTTLTLLMVFFLNQFVIGQEDVTTPDSKSSEAQRIGDIFGESLTLPVEGAPVPDGTKNQFAPGARFLDSDGNTVVVDSSKAETTISRDAIPATDTEELRNDVEIIFGEQKWSIYQKESSRSQGFWSMCLAADTYRKMGYQFDATGSILNKVVLPQYEVTKAGTLECEPALDNDGERLGNFDLEIKSIEINGEVVRVRTVKDPRTLALKSYETDVLSDLFYDWKGMRLLKQGTERKGGEYYHGEYVTTYHMAPTDDREIEE